MSMTGWSAAVRSTMTEVVAFAFAPVGACVMTTWKRRSMEPEEMTGGEMLIVELVVLEGVKLGPKT